MDALNVSEKGHKPSPFSHLSAFLERTNLTQVQLWLAVLLAALLFVSRSPTLFTQANFYAEDGQTWFKEAYDLGWLRSLTLPAGGYLNSLQRLLTGPALLVPFHLAPLADAVMGLLVQLLPIPILLSNRCRSWGTLDLRCLFAVIYVLYPNSREVHVVLTNSQWHLAVVLALLAFADVPQSRLGLALDAALFLLAGFCGPFGIALLPFLVSRYVFWGRERWVAVEAALLAVGASVQVFVLFHAPQRTPLPLGATVSRLVRIAGGEVFVDSVIGGHYKWANLPFAVDLLGLAVGGVILVQCLRDGNRPLKGLILYAAALLAAGLHSPLGALGGTDKPMWDQLIEDPICRYWYLPGIAFLWASAWCWRRAPSLVMRRLGAAVLLLTCFGVLISWNYRAFPNQDFPAHARTLEQAPAGTRVVIPIGPEVGRTVELVKH